jgi:tetratricopeptide (TPR) repeat protein
MQPKTRGKERNAIAFGLVICLCLRLALKSHAQDHQPSVAAAKAQDRGKSGANRWSLEPVPDPDLSGMEDVVLEQLRDARSELMALTQRPGVTANALAPAYGNIGMLYQTYGLQEAAKVCYSNAGTLAPREFKWQYYLGYLFRTTGELQKALVCFQNAMEIRPDEVVLLRLAEVNLDLNRTEAAKPLFDRVLASNNSSAAAMLGLGKIALRDHDFAKAVEYCAQSLAIQPQASSIHYSLAMAYRGLGNLSEAQAHLVKQGPNAPVVLDPLLDDLAKLKKGKADIVMRASQAMDEGRFSEGVEAYRKIVAITPKDPNARTYLAVALARAGDVQEAIEQLSEALRIAPDDAQAHYCLGVVLLAVGSEQTAIEHLRAAVKSDPGLKEGHFELANLLMRARHYDEAAREYAKVVKIEPGNRFARIMAAMAFVRMKNYSEALAQLERAHHVLPDDFDVASALARLLAASPETSVRDAARALPLIQEVIKAQGSMDADQGQTLAMALAETGQFAKAAGLQRLLLTNLENSQDSELVTSLRDNLALYERGQACRLPWRDDDPIFFPVPKRPELPSQTSLAKQR